MRLDLLLRGVLLAGLGLGSLFPRGLLLNRLSVVLSLLHSLFLLLGSMLLLDLRLPVNLGMLLNLGLLLVLWRLLDLSLLRLLLGVLQLVSLLPEL